MKMLKWAGLLPVLVGGILSRFIAPDFLSTFDALKGFQGLRPHLAALGAFGLAYYVARLTYKKRVHAKADSLRRNWGIAALILLFLSLNLYIPLPEDSLSPGFAMTRWIVTLVCYLFFYVSLGASLAPGGR